MSAHRTHQNNESRSRRVNQVRRPRRGRADLATTVIFVNTNFQSTKTNIPIRKQKQSIEFYITDNTTGKYWLAETLFGLGGIFMPTRYLKTLVIVYLYVDHIYVVFIILFTLCCTNIMYNCCTQCLEPSKGIF